MASHLLVFLDQYPYSFEEWQASIDLLSFPLKLKASGPIARHKGGAIPMVLGGEDVYVEMSLETLSALSEFFKRLPLEGRKKVIDFKYGSNWKETCCALGASAPLISTCNALVYNDFMSFGFINYDKIISDFHTGIENNGF
jgi:hypothetical protein